MKTGMQAGMEDEQDILRYITIYPSSPLKFMPPNHWFGDHIPDANIFYYVIEGEFMLIVGNHNYVVRPHQLALLPQGIRHIYKLTSKKYLQCYRVGFKAEINSEDAFRLLDLAEDNHVVNVTNYKKVEGIFETSTFNHNFKNGYSYRMHHCSNIASLIAEYIEMRIDNKPAGDVGFFKPVLEYMQRNLTQEITNEVLAGQVFLNPIYFIRKFKQAFGVPPLKYYNDLRAKKATDCLMNTEMSNAEIAASIGIKDLYYFYKFFKKHYGMSPKDYKELFGFPSHWQ